MATNAKIDLNTNAPGPSSVDKPGKKAGHKFPEKSSTASLSGQCPEHSFLTDVADVRAMEQGLVQLLDDFHSGKLQAFAGGSTTFEKMDEVREQQEKLARLHFEMEVQQDAQKDKDFEGQNKSSEDKMAKLMNQLHTISSAIQKMQKD